MREETIKLKLWKKTGARFLCGLLFLCLVIQFTSVEVQAESGELDLIFIIDDTGSMKTSDPDELTTLAVKQFVDIVPDTYDVQYGIATYALDILDSLSLGTNSDTIKYFADKNVERAGALTDAASGLEWGVNELLTNGREDAQKVIILIGDGENDLQSSRTTAESDTTLNAAIADAQDSGIQVYTLALNPDEVAHKEYFSNIANQTDGEIYLPEDAEDIAQCMKEIYQNIFNLDIEQSEQISLEENVPYTEEVEVPEGVYEMILQCETNGNLDITFESSDGTIYDKNSSEVVYEYDSDYVVYQIKSPQSGIWTITYLSESKQTITPEFILFATLITELSVDATEVTEGQVVTYSAKVTYAGADVTEDEIVASLNMTFTDVNGVTSDVSPVEMTYVNGQYEAQYMITEYGVYDAQATFQYDELLESNTVTTALESKYALSMVDDNIGGGSIKKGTSILYTADVEEAGQAITDVGELENLSVTLYVEETKKDGSVTSIYEGEMELSGTSFVLEYTFDSTGDYLIYSEVSEESSNVLYADVTRNPVVMIGGGIGALILLLAVAFLLIRWKQSSDYLIYDKLNIKIYVKSSEGRESFAKHAFNCEQIFEKEDTLTSAIRAYRKAYQAINDFPGSINTLDKYINSTLTEVTDDITIKGTKSKSAILVVPAKYNMKVDDNELEKHAKIVFSQLERNIKLEFENNGCTYTLNLDFICNM